MAFWHGTGDVMGEPELRRDLTVTERTALERRVTDLRSAVAPAPERSRDTLMKAISRMLGGFPQMQGHDFGTAQVIASSYLFTVRNHPHWAIVKACEKISTGTAGINVNFCPTEAAFAVVVANCTDMYRRMLATAEAVLRAKVLPLPAPKAAREDIEAVLGRQIGDRPVKPVPAEPGYAARVTADLRARRAARQAAE